MNQTLNLRRVVTTPFGSLYVAKKLGSLKVKPGNRTIKNNKKNEGHVSVGRMCPVALTFIGNSFYVLFYVHVYI